MPERRSEEDSGFPALRRNVAAVDAGKKRQSVCAPTIDGAGREVASFGATTLDLVQMAEWLLERHVVSVALECRRFYWIAPMEILESRGMEVLLVNTHLLRQVPGRHANGDATDCEWIQRLHCCGLLRASVQPDEGISGVRKLIRRNAALVVERAQCMRRMEKSLDGVAEIATIRTIAPGQQAIRGCRAACPA